MDFTYSALNMLLTTLQNADFSFQTFAEYIEKKGNKSEIQKYVILRQDVDALPENALRFARIQADMGIKGTYYFRTVPQSWDKAIIKEITALGHEVGYHYENMDTCNGDVDKAYDEFCRNLETFRKLTEIKTISMHGSPKSKYDSKDIWSNGQGPGQEYDYRALRIIGEPYFNIDFNKVFYLTDTGRRWDGWKTSIRDKVPQQDEWVKQGLVFHSTNDIIKAIQENRFPAKAMITTHPQRWTDKPLPWLKELVWQGVKNVGKRILVKRTK